VPLRIALGHKDMEKKTVELVRRDTGGKEYVPWEELVKHVVHLLDTIQVHLPSPISTIQPSILH
jgi:prolyl-tRNA synthetase